MMSQDPAMADPSAEAEGGYTIEIAVSGDNSFFVSVGSAAQEGAEGGGEDAEGQQFTSVKPMLTAVLAIIKGGGQMPQGESDQDASFNEGFGGQAPAQ